MSQTQLIDMRDILSGLILICAYLILNASCQSDCTKNQHGNLRPDASDCSKYFRCENRLESEEYFWKIEECPPYQYFNRTISDCLPNYDSCKDAPSAPYIRCIDSNKQEDPQNENKYFICQENEWKSEVCSSSDVFDRATKECGEEKLCEKGALKSDTNDGSKYYVCNQNAEWVSMKCKSGMYFKKEQNKCSYEDDNTNRAKQIPTSTIPPTTTTTKIPFVEKCIETTIKPDIQDCSRYFVCQNNTWLLKICSADQYFDIFFLECRTDENGNCNNRTQTNTQSETSNTVCTNGDSKADEMECTKFYSCSHNKWVPMTCKTNMYFNAAQKKCIWDDGTCQKTEDDSNEINKSKDETKKSCKEDEKKMDIQDCGRYYECSNGKWVSKECDRFSFYSARWKRCTLNDGSCDRSKNVESQKQKTKAPNKSKGICLSGETKTDETDCTKYYACRNQKWVSLKCNEAAYFNDKEKRCMPNDGFCKSNEEKKEGEGNHGGCKNGDSRPDLFECGRYYLCKNDVWGTAECKPKMYYDKSTKKCVADEGLCNTEISLKEDPDAFFGICQEGETKPHKTDCTRYLKCKKDIWITFVCHKNMFFSEEEKRCVKEDGTCNPSEIKETSSQTMSCEKEGDIKEDEVSCNRYYYCRDSKWKLFSCPKRYFYNRDNKYCLPNIDSCNPVKPYSDKAECTEGKFKSGGATKSSYFECFNTQWVARICKNKQVFDMTSGKCEANKQMSDIKKQPKVDADHCSDGTQKAHPDDRNSFYVCLNGMWEAKTCPYGLIFDPNSTICLPNMSLRNAEIKI